MNTWNTNWRRWILLALWLLAIACFSTAEFSSDNTLEYFGQWNNEARLAAHLSVYAALSALLAAAFATGGGNQYKAVVMASIGATLVAMFDEWHQSGLVDRSGRLSDVMRDHCGASLGALLWLSYHKLGEWCEYLKGAHPVIYAWAAGLGRWIRAGTELGLIFGTGLYFWLYLHRAPDASGWELLLGGLKISGFCALLGAITGGARGLLSLLCDAIRYCRQQIAG